MRDGSSKIPTIQRILGKETVNTGVIYLHLNVSVDKILILLNHLMISHKLMRNRYNHSNITALQLT